MERQEEDKEDGRCGKRKRAMYGTGDAAWNWEYEYTDLMIKEWSVGLRNVCLRNVGSQTTAPARNQPVS